MSAIVLYAAFSYYQIASWLNRMLVNVQVTDPLDCFQYSNATWQGRVGKVGIALDAEIWCDTTR